MSPGTGPRPGSREWREKFQRDRESFDRWWQRMMALSLVAAFVFLMPILAGVLPLWLLFV